MNENLKAPVSHIPIKRLAAIVIPERETPGRTAIPCAMPTTMAIFNKEFFLCLCEITGTDAITIAVKINPHPTYIGDAEIKSTVFLIGSPIKAVKNEAIKIAQPYDQPGSLSSDLVNQPENHS